MTLFELSQYAEKELIKADIENAHFESVLLIQHFFHLTPTEWLTNRSKAVFEDLAKPFYHALQERKQHRPLQYILGNWEFMELEIAVGEGVLIPREDTEVLVRMTSDWIGSQENLHGADLCAGSGAVALGLCSLRPDLEMTAIEISSTAYSFLVENADTYSEYAINALQGDILNESFIHMFSLPFDFIVSNPPYIASYELPTLQAEVQQEPALALDGGEDGLFFYRQIISLWKDKLKTGGFLGFEIGETQADAVCHLLEQNGFIEITVKKDLAGLDRAVKGIKS